MKVLILCTQNSCRSQMGQGFLESFDPKWTVCSAGTSPADKVNQMAVNVMKEVGIDLSNSVPKNVDQYLDQQWDYVITVCDNAKETCPVFSGNVKHLLHIGFEDPSAADGSDEFILSEFRRVRDIIKKNLYSFYIMAQAESLPATGTKLGLTDYLGAIKVRWGFGRDKYVISSGLYKVGSPDSDSDVFVTANYKLSFDTLRKNLDSLNAWILVIDTKGVNVWCAAGKKTFGTQAVIKSIKETALEHIVRHRKIILPQLGATGVAAHIVKEKTGFRVVYGPVRATDIKIFINNEYKATREMRRVNFTLYDRIKLIPVDLLYGKYKLMIVLLIAFILSGLDNNGIEFSDMYRNSLYPVVNILLAYITGIVISPVMLPYTPFRAFALKGAFWGAFVFILTNLFMKAPTLDRISTGILCIAISSFNMMNFTGSTTYTSLSGVKKEMKWAIPLQIGSVLVALILFIISKLS